MKKFSQFAKDNPYNSISEGSWLNKGFALVQYSAHENSKQRLNAAASKVQSLCDQGQQQHDLEKKLNLLFEILSTFADALRTQGELSKSTINVGVASALLGEDFSATLKQLFRQKR